MDVCIAYAPLVAMAVALLKRIPFIGSKPKTVALVLSGLAVMVPAFVKGTGTVEALIPCVLQLLAGTIATHEIVLKPVGKALSTEPTV